jgi:protein involved in polysaccharide export with SLBB domain
MSAAALLLSLSIIAPAAAQTGTSAKGTEQEPSSGPIRLRQNVPSAVDRNLTTSSTTGSTSGGTASPAIQRTPPTAAPSEFELFVQRVAGSPTPIRRFGAELMTLVGEPGAAETAPLTPPDYLIKPGDELLITLWGSVDADIQAVVDRSGRIAIPRVGPIVVGGVRYGEVNDVVSKRVAQVFRNFQVSTSLGRLQAQRIYVTGFVAQPGAYVVGSQSTLLQGLMRAGGPSASGSFRQVELRRGKERIATVDLYDFLLRGDRNADRLLQPEDVIHVHPVGRQVGLIGSVNRPGVFELKSNEAVSDALAMAGGFSSVADRSRLALERLDDRTTVRIANLALPAAGTALLSDGDVLRAFSVVDLALPVQHQNKRVRVEGEVARPGEYVLPPASTLTDALAAAGGLTAAAYPYGTEFSRESVRLTQQQNYERALRDLETDLARNASAQRATSSDEVAAQSARDSANNRLLASLRALKPSGRVVLQMEPSGRELPALAIEDGDRIYVPPQPTSVGVFGSVFNAGSYLYREGRQVGDYLNLAGGPTRGADATSAFVIRANGTVVSGLQSSGTWSRGSGLAGVRAEPGDTVFVPEELNKSTFVQNAKDWTQILYQFGLGLAAIATFR